MARSMTGFGRGEAAKSGTAAVFEIRSVNHRYFDLAIKTPRILARFEDRIRDAVQKRVLRGKVDVYASYENVGAGARTVFVDESLAGAYASAFRALGSKLGIEADITVSLLARMPDVFKAGQDDSDDEQLWLQPSRALEAALDALCQMREREGGKLKSDMALKISDIEGRVSRIGERAPFVAAEHKARLEARIKELLGQELPDPGRLAAETAIFADRSCIDEELVRLSSHIAQFREGLEQPSGAMGRRLDFIIQEMNREINTIGSKSSDLGISSCVVDIKSDIEKLREQAQNIE